MFSPKKNNPVARVSVAIIFLFLIAFLGVFCADLASAQTAPTTLTGKGLVPCGHGTSASDACTLCHLIIGIKGLIDWGLAILVTASLVAIAIAGVMYVVSTGSEQMMGTAKAFLSASLTGFAVVLAAWLIVNTTMWLISAKADLGIEKSGWTTFSCNIISSAASALPPNGHLPATSCCVKTQSASDPRYGNMSQNCSEPSVTEANPEGSCSEGEKVQGVCSTLPACGAGRTAGNDAEIRKRLQEAGISINKPDCPTPQDTNCTSLNQLPENAVSGLINIRNKCGPITVTGGTEAGHRSHGQGKAIVDLGWNSGVAQCIHDNASALGVSLMCNNYRQNEVNCNFAESGAPHMHVVF